MTALRSEGLKRCPQCGETKPVSDFYGRKQLSGYCKPCSKQRSKANYHSDPEAFKERYGFRGPHGANPELTWPDPPRLTPVASALGYAITEDGVVWSTKTLNGRTLRGPVRWHPLRPRLDKDGYLTITLSIDGKKVTRKVHQLVLETFVGPRPPGTEACHWPDPTRTNNAVGNLRWDTQAENIKDRDKAGRTAKGESQGRAKLTEDGVRAIRRDYVRGHFGGGGSNAKALCEQYGISQTLLYKVVRRESWKHVL